MSLHVFDLEERTLKFSENVRNFTRVIPKTLANTEYVKQVIRSSSSIGANYIEANESLSKKDFVMRCKICRKEAKETRYWLFLIDTPHNDHSVSVRDRLVEEATELMKIFNSIIQKSN